MQPTYDPLQVESLWDAWWEERGYYAAKTNAEKSDAAQQNFVMVIPPPNVTGSLHLGHALMATIEDASGSIATLTAEADELVSYAEKNCFFVCI